ncbi:MAG: peptidoglycan-binding domain-containing protein [Acidimicrobiales bacterium]
MLYLRPTTRGDDVTDLQQRLGRPGFDTAWIDGIFGPETEAALRDFQLNQGLTGDGVVGRETIAALERLRPAVRRQDRGRGTRIENGFEPTSASKAAGS